MSNFVIEIKAPELVEALKSLPGQISLALLKHTAEKVEAENPKAKSQQPVKPTANPTPAPIPQPQAFNPVPQQPAAPYPPQVPQTFVSNYHMPQPVTSAPSAAPGYPPQQTYRPAPVTPAPAPAAPAPAYTLADLGRAAAQLMDMGKDPRTVLAQFSINELKQLKPDQFGAFATALRQLGARI